MFNDLCDTLCLLRAKDNRCVFHYIRIAQIGKIVLNRIDCFLCGLQINLKPLAGISKHLLWNPRITENLMHLVVAESYKPRHTIFPVERSDSQLCM